MHQANLKAKSSPCCNSLCKVYSATPSKMSSKSTMKLQRINCLLSVVLALISLVPTRVDSFMNLYLTRNEMLRLLGTRTKLYYIQEGKVNDYALSFQVPVPPNISSLYFNWQNLVSTTPIFYSFGISVSDSHAISAPSINISLTGAVPLHEQVIKISFNCRRNYNAEVDVNIYLNLTLSSSPENVTSLILRRKKICFTSMNSGDGSSENSSSPPVAARNPYYTHAHHHTPKGSINYDETSSVSPSDIISSSKSLSPYFPPSSGGNSDILDSLNVQSIVPSIHHHSSPNAPDEHPTRDHSTSRGSSSKSPTLDSVKTIDNNPVYIAVACAIGFLIILSILLYLCYLLIQRCFFENSHLHSNVVSSLNYPHNLPCNTYNRTLTNSQHYYYSGIPSIPGTLIRSDKNTTQINPFVDSTLYSKEATNSLQAKSVKSNATASSHKQSDYSVVSFIYQDLDPGTYFV